MNFATIAAKSTFLGAQKLPLAILIFYKIFFAKKSILAIKTLFEEKKLKKNNKFLRPKKSRFCAPKKVVFAMAKITHLGAKKTTQF